MVRSHDRHGTLKLLLRDTTLSQDEQIHAEGPDLHTSPRAWTSQPPNPPYIVGISEPHSTTQSRS